ncbi:MAG TPA: hypothetical protein VFH43_02185 [Candidatus Kapabacteria bacterium]|nr:hypothetical protein [Candidatus Kapabacteria bacterium]
MKHFLSILACSAIAGLALTGCDNATDAPAIDAWKSPDAGTLLVFRETLTMEREGQFTTNTSSPAYEFISTEQQIFGENNVSTVIDPNGDTMYVSLRENGDFAIGGKTSSGVTWDVFPTGSKGTVTVHDYDSVTNGTDHEISKKTRTYLGEEEIQIADKYIYTIKILQNETQRLVSAGVWDFLTVATDTIYFAPDFGFYVRQRGHVTNSEFDQLKSTHTTSLDLQAYIKQ